mmetsp:Transcript_11693/g.39092  ORF Transcript_11693/g.39092 Transcript_11693/m.39092 type:complete len:315 (+) Transcript_11693:1343-2287(+)
MLPLVRLGRLCGPKTHDELLNEVFELRQQVTPGEARSPVEFQENVVHANVAARKRIPTDAGDDDGHAQLPRRVERGAGGERAGVADGEDRVIGGPRRRRGFGSRRRLGGEGAFLDLEAVQDPLRHRGVFAVAHGRGEVGIREALEVEARRGRELAREETPLRRPLLRAGVAHSDVVNGVESAKFADHGRGAGAARDEDVGPDARRLHELAKVLRLFDVGFGKVGAFREYQGPELGVRVIPYCGPKPGDVARAVLSRDEDEDEALHDPPEDGNALQVVLGDDDDSAGGGVSRGEAPDEHPVDVAVVVRHDQDALV